MPVTGADIPPAKSAIVDVLRLQKRRIKDQSRLGGAFGKRGEARDWIGQMFERLKAGYEIKLAGRAVRIFGDDRIVRYRYRKAVFAENGAKRIVSAAVVEDARVCSDRTPQLHDALRIRTRSCGSVIRVDQVVVAIIYVGSELIVAPVVKRVGEQKPAGLAAAIVNRHP